MHIGAIAKKIGLSIDAIRVYERNSLLPRPPRKPGGIRQYAEADVETLAFVRRAQSLGFRLRGIPRERWEDWPASAFWNGPVFRVIPGLEKALADQPR